MEEGEGKKILLQEVGLLVAKGFAHFFPRNVAVEAEGNRETHFLQIDDLES